jgi:hypothetical protein
VSRYCPLGTHSASFTFSFFLLFPFPPTLSSHPPSHLTVPYGAFPRSRSRVSVDGQTVPRGGIPPPPAHAQADCVLHPSPGDGTAPADVYRAAVRQPGASSRPIDVDVLHALPQPPHSGSPPHGTGSARSDVGGHAVSTSTPRIPMHKKTPAHKLSYTAAAARAAIGQPASHDGRPNTHRHHGRATNSTSSTRGRGQQKHTWTNAAGETPCRTAVHHAVETRPLVDVKKQDAT